jgi:hypothetical protein
VINGNGLLFVSIINDSDDHGGFRVRARQSTGVSRIIDVPASGNLTFGDFSAGEVELTLLAPEACSVAPPNPRMINAEAGEPINVGFEVHCS